MSGRRYVASHVGANGKMVRHFGEMAADALHALVHDEEFLQQVEAQSGRPGVIVFRLTEESDLR